MRKRIHGILNIGKSVIISRATASGQTGYHGSNISREIFCFMSEEKVICVGRRQAGRNEGDRAWLKTPECQNNVASLYVYNVRE